LKKYLSPIGVLFLDVELCDLEDVLSYLIPLSFLVGVDVLPANEGITGFTIDVTAEVHPSHQLPLFHWTQDEIDHPIEQVGLAIPSVEIG
jgi:hypothetical protein